MTLLTFQIPLTPVLTLHIAAGTTGVLAGGVALFSRKGAPVHRLAGALFFVAMLTMAATAIYLAISKSQMSNVLSGSLTIYVVTTAWVAARRRDGEVGLFEVGAFILSLAGSAGIFLLAWLASHGARQLLTGTPVQAAYVFGLVTAMAAILDLSVVVRRGLFGAQRIARHLWRMCLGLFFAVGSFAAQGARALPPIVRESNILIIPMVGVLVLLAFWLVRVLFLGWYTKSEKLQSDIGETFRQAR